MPPIVQRCCRRAAALWHGLWARLCYRLGAPARARRNFERVLELRGDDFAAYLHLGRIAWAEGDYGGWQRELEHARRTAPDRFARLRHGLELFHPRAAGTLFEETGERATWRSATTLRSSSVGSARHGAEEDEDPLDVIGGLPGLEPFALDPCRRLRRTGDDFSSEEERRHFAGSAPITRREIEASDLDDLAERLGG